MNSQHNYCLPAYQECISRCIKKQLHEQNVNCRRLGASDSGNVQDLDEWEWDGVDADTEGWPCGCRLWTL